MSKRSTNTQRRADRHVFFLDENLGANSLAQFLRSEGFKIVTHRERYGGASSIKDPQIIADCKRYRTALITADANLETTWAKEIIESKIAIIVRSNNKDGPAKWGDRIVKARDVIFDQLGVRKKPFILRLNDKGKITHIRVFKRSGPKLIKL